MASYLLLENGGRILLESGGGLLLESSLIPLTGETPEGVAVRPVAAPDEPIIPTAPDLLRLQNSAVIDNVYLVELMPFAPAGSTLPV
jgi:hypothetical protein